VGDLGKKVLIGGGIVVVLVILALGFLTSRFVDQEEILRVEREAARLEAQRNMLQLEVARRDSIQRRLEARVDTYRGEADSLRTEVADLELERQRNQLSVRMLRRPSELQRRLVDTYPELGAEPWGVTEVHDDENDISLQYLLVPLWFSETFIIEHQNAASFETQRDKLLQVDSLRVVASVLQDSVITLGREKEAVYQAVYDSCFVAYQDLNGKYVDLLKKPPQVKLGPPNWLTAAIAGGVGIAIGTAF